MKTDFVTKTIRIIKKEGILSYIIAVIEYLSDLIIPKVIAGYFRMVVFERNIPLPDKEGNWILYSIPTLEKKRKIPSISETMYGTHHGSDMHIDMLKQIYSYEGFVEVEDGDTVVDVGAYIGGFTYYAKEVAGTVIAIDPFAVVNRSLYFNFSNDNNVMVVSKAAWNKQDKISINLSDDPSKTSVFSPNYGDKDKSVPVPSDTVPNIVRSEGFKTIDYLKLEGEGSEPEIIKGIIEDPMIVKKIAIDAKQERDSGCVKEDVLEILNSNGYECRVKKDAPYWGEHIVFAKYSVGLDPC